MEHINEVFPCQMHCRMQSKITGGRLTSCASVTPVLNFLLAGRTDSNWLSIFKIA